MKVEAGFARRITAIAKSLQVERICMRPSWIAPRHFDLIYVANFNVKTEGIDGSRCSHWTYIRRKDIRSAVVICEDVRSANISENVRSASITCEHVPADVICEYTRTENTRDEDVRSAGIICKNVRSADVRVRGEDVRSADVRCEDVG